MASSPPQPSLASSQEQEQQQQQTSRQKSSVTTTTSHAWETMKENAAPIMRGRNVTQLEQSMLSHDAQLHAERMIQYYEQRIQQQQQQQSDDTTDILIDWIAYIKFHQDVYPTQTHAQFVLLERCVCHIINNTNHTTTLRSKYKNDVRFIRICCLYADQTAEPCTTFQELYQTYEIGTTSAMFWNAWAYCAEREQDYALAEQIFTTALSSSSSQVPQPIEYLQLRYQRFQRRMSSYYRKQAALLLDDDHNDNNDSSSTTRRGILGSLSSSTLYRGQSQQMGRQQPATTTSRRLLMPTFTDRTTSTAASTSSHRPTFVSSNNNANNDSKPRGAFTVFSDEADGPSSLSSAQFMGTLRRRSQHDDESHHHPTHREREPEAERWKENRGRTEKWNERGGLSAPLYSIDSSTTTTASSINSSAVPPAAAAVSIRATTSSMHSRPIMSAFAIHVDDECVAEHRAVEATNDQTALVHQRARDDRRHQHNAIQQQQRDRPDHRPSNNTTKQSSTGMRPQWKHRLLTDTATGLEQSFEEARYKANFYTTVPSTRMTNLNLLFPHSKSGNNGDDALEEDMSMSMEELVSIDEESFVLEEMAKGGGAGGDEIVIIKPKQRPALAPLKLADSDGIPSATATSFAGGDTPPATPLLQDRNKKHPPISSFAATIRQDSSFDSQQLLPVAPTPHNTSTVSSSFAAKSAVRSSVRRKDDPTINTQLALKELSMMFYSPAVPDIADHHHRITTRGTTTHRTGGLGPILLNESTLSDTDANTANNNMGSIPNNNTGAAWDMLKQQHRDLPLRLAPERQLFTIHSDYDSSSLPNSGLQHHSETNDENPNSDHPSRVNTHARTNTFPHFDDVVLRALPANQAGGGIAVDSTSHDPTTLSCHRPTTSSVVVAVGHSSRTFQTLPREDEMPTSFGANIYSNDDVDQQVQDSIVASSNGIPTFSIFCDGDDDGDSERKAPPAFNHEPNARYPSNTGVHADNAYGGSPLETEINDHVANEMATMTTRMDRFVVAPQLGLPRNEDEVVFRQRGDGATTVPRHTASRTSMAQSEQHQNGADHFESLNDFSGEFVYPIYRSCTESEAEYPTLPDVSYIAPLDD